MELRNLELSKMSREALMHIKNKKLAEVYQILALCLGQPPTQFYWQYKTKEGEISEPKIYTPQEFFKEVLDINFNDYVLFTDDPSKEYNRDYEIRQDRHIKEGTNRKFINIKSDLIKEFAIASIKSNEGMYFSCDVGKQHEKEKGFLDVNTYDFSSLFATTFNMDKKMRIETFESGSTHGMALMGVNITKDKTADKWLLENNWGKKGHNEYLIMTDDWFDEYMFRLVVHKKYIDSETLKILDQDALISPPWDPMFMMDR